MSVAVVASFDRLGQWPSRSISSECQDNAGLEHPIVANGVTRPHGENPRKLADASHRCNEVPTSAWFTAAISVPALQPQASTVAVHVDGV